MTRASGHHHRPPAPALLKAAGPVRTAPWSDNMKVLSNLKARRKLFLGLFSIIILAALLAVGAYLSLGSMKNSLFELYRVESSVSADLKELRANQSADRQDVMSMMLDQAPLQQRLRLQALAERARAS